MGQNGSRSYQIQLCHFVLTSLLQDVLLYHGASALSSPPRAAAAENAAGRRRRRTEAPKSAKKPSPTGGIWPLGSARSGHFRFGRHGRRARRTEKRQYAPLRGGKHKGENESPRVLPALGGRGGFPQASCRRPHSAPRRPVPIAVSFLGLCADGASTRLPQLFSGFVQTASRRPLARLVRRGCPLRLREGGSPRSARRSPGPPSRCPAGGNSRRWRP